jgi:isatin hydrolase
MTPSIERETAARTLSEIITADRVVDLTLPLDETLPCSWPGHMPYRATVWTWFTDRPDDPQPVHLQTGGDYQTRWLVIDEHTGTHLDAPRHFIPPPNSSLPHAGPAGTIGIASPVLAASGPAAVIPASIEPDSVRPGHSPRITPQHVRDWETEHGALDGEVVLFQTGWDRHYQPGFAGTRYGPDVLTTATKPGWPAPTPDTIDLLHHRRVTCVGTDGLSVGPAENGAPTHLAGLPHGLVYVEALTALDRLPARGAGFIFLPIKLVGGTGGPGRAIAVTPNPANPDESNRP